MRAKQILRPAALFLVVFAVACSAGPPPQEIARARLAIQDAKSANADQRAARDYDAAVAHFNVAQNSWNEKKDGPTAAHWARLAEAEARQAQARAELGAAEEDLRLQTDRKQRGELAVRDAEIMSLQARARTEAEKRAAEAEVRAAEERRRTEEELTRREAAARETERIRSEAEARLNAERQRTEGAAAQRSQAERDRVAADLEKMKTELERTRQEAETARKAAEAERQQLEQQRQAQASRVAELERARQQQQQTEEALKKTLSQLGQVREEARGLILTLPGNIYFDVNRSEIKPSMRDRLTEIARALATVPDRHVLVEGHTDSDGSSEYNLKLSRLRAESVRSILIAGGVAPEQIESQGYGKTRPVASNVTATGKAENRRVEVVVQGAAAPVR
jgi:outer membrane protein OmpA-like peptidoglycan-associated protein